jgi:hypothetical protein
MTSGSPPRWATTCPGGLDRPKLCWSAHLSGWSVVVGRVRRSLAWVDRPAQRTVDP